MLPTRGFGESPTGRPARQAVVGGWSGDGQCQEEHTYRYTGFVCDHFELVCDHFEHVCYGNVAQTLGYCQRCGSILEKNGSKRVRSDKEAREEGHSATCTESKFTSDYSEGLE